LRRKPEYFNRVLLGAISGGAIILFVNYLVDDGGTVLHLSSAALGFVAGYSTDFLFNAIERVVAAVFPKTDSDPKAQLQRTQKGPARKPPPPAGGGGGEPNASDNAEAADEDEIGAIQGKQRKVARESGEIVDRRRGDGRRWRSLMRRTISSAPPSGTEQRTWRRLGWLLLAALSVIVSDPGPEWSAGGMPVPLLSKGGEPVDWWFAFKFNSQNGFAGCGADTGKRTCIFGGNIQAREKFGQQFAVASSRSNVLSQGKGCVGATTSDPIGATFDQVYNGNFNYVIWNDQFYGDPALSTCKSSSCGAPWGHSKDCSPGTMPARDS
jgi:hypothetical protein